MGHVCPAGNERVKLVGTVHMGSSEVRDWRLSSKTLRKAVLRMYRNDITTTTTTTKQGNIISYITNFLLGWNVDP
jgi:hypothetical protein